MALDLWTPARRTTPGGQPVYSDFAIETCLTLGMVFRQPLRQTRRLIGSIARLLGVEIAVPSFSTLSRRGKALTLSVAPQFNSQSGLQLVVEGTGVEIFGAGEWREEKHKTKRKQRAWRKLRLGLDLVSGEIVCSDLTTDDVGHSTALPDLVDQIDGPVDLFLGDGAYDGDPNRDFLIERFGTEIDVAIPPPKNAVLSPNAARNPTARDCQIIAIEAHGRMAWQTSSGYNQRSRGGTLIGRWKAVIGPKLKARSFENQKTEARIGTHILNRMTKLGRPHFERTA